MPHILFKNVTKQFGDFVACQNVTIEVQHGKIHAFIGENGAGKSTVMKLLGGLHPVTSGEILIAGETYRPRSAQDAFQKRIAFIHQHFVLAEQMTALENLELSLSSHMLSLKIRDKENILNEAKKFLKKFNWKLNLHSKVEELSVGEQQRLEILKALMTHPEIIIFDEPTAVLTPQESQELLNFLLDLKKEGKTILIVSHKLNEIKFVADSISILRQGELVITSENSELSIEKMAENMIGRILQKKEASQAHTSLQKIFTLPATQIDVYKNEIFGFVGIEGNGQHQLIQKLIHIFRDLNLKFGDITEDRLKLSVFGDLTLQEHMALRYGEQFLRMNFIDQTRLQQATFELLQKWDVRPVQTDKPLSELSGGNQQKFVVGRELWGQPEILLAAHPTRGVDLGAQEKIHQALLEYSRNSATVLLFSSDLDEMMYLSDRFMILNKSVLYGPFKRGQLSEKEIGLLMAAESTAELKMHEAGVI